MCLHIFIIHFRMAWSIQNFFPSICSWSDYYPLLLTQQQQRNIYDFTTDSKINTLQWRSQNQRTRTHPYVLWYKSRAGIKFTYKCNLKVQPLCSPHNTYFCNRREHELQKAGRGPASHHKVYSRKFSAVMVCWEAH